MPTKYISFAAWTDEDNDLRTATFVTDEEPRVRELVFREAQGIFADEVPPNREISFEELDDWEAKLCQPLEVQVYRVIDGEVSRCILGPDYKWTWATS